MESLLKFEQCTERQRKSKIMKKTVFGIIAVLAGLLLLGFNLEILNPHWRHIFFSWQMLLIAIGLVNISDKDSFLTGIVLLTIGSVFIIPEFIDVPFKVKQIFWPVILIFVGIAAIIKHRFRISNHKYGRHGRHRWFEEGFTEGKTDENGTVQQTNIFGGSKRIFTNSVFNGGKITNIFGGGEIDLRQTQLGEGRVYFEINSVFGGMKIIVPSDWVVNIEVNSIMGGFQDKRVIIQKNESIGSENELVIVGYAVFGGGEIRSA